MQTPESPRPISFIYAMTGIRPEENLSKSEKSVKPRWKHMLNGEAQVKEAIRNGTYFIFAGGACNKVDSEGNTVRTNGRDEIVSRLDAMGIATFDPQVHPTTHGGRVYKWEIDGDAEKLAIESSLNDLIELRQDTVGAVSCMEIIRDVRNGKDRKSKRVVYIYGYSSEAKAVSLYFKPEGVAQGTATEAARRQHYKEYEKSANQMRKELLAMLKIDKYLFSDLNPTGNVHVVVDESTEGDGLGKVNELKTDESIIIEITDKKAHYVDLLRAFHLAGEEKKVIIYFKGMSKDSKSNPTVTFPAYPEYMMENGNKIEDLSDAFVQIGNYMKEVNDMRELLVQIIDEDANTDIVSSADEAVQTLLKNKENQSIPAAVVL